MVAQRGPRYITVEEWRELERNSHDAKHEYIDGQVHLMAGGNANHARISSNTLRLLEDALGESPCNVYNSDLSVRLSPTRYTYPDISVTCDERDQGEIDMVQSPRLIVEVLSESTEAYNRGKKFALYRQCSTIQEYVLICTDHQAVEVFRRTAEGWMAYHALVYGPSDTIELASIGVQFPLSALYKRTTVRETLQEQGGLPDSAR
jgi:Uma2 family endonuclease